MMCFEKKEDIKKNQRDALEEMAKMPLLAVPLPKPKTVIEFELEVNGWTTEEVSEVTKKICEEHEGKRDLHIKIFGTVLRRELS